MYPNRFLLLLLVFSSSVWACDFEQVQFASDFPTGRLSQCEATPQGRYLLTLKPEDKDINPSPWYHFSVYAEKQSTIPVALVVKGYAPRYMPKYSTDGNSWQALPFDTNNGQVQFNVPVPAGKKVYIAAQPPITNADYKAWTQSLTKATPGLEVSLLGQSKQGRDILVLTKQQPDNHEWLVILGRQHPPEITGAQALMDFSERMLEDSALTKQFLDRFNVLWIPNINPDGVAAGNWRHTTDSQDLNRDWVKFSQPESRLVRDKLKSISAAGGKIAFALDFHSTYYDVFYTMPDGYSIAPVAFTEQWLNDLQAYTNGMFKVSVKPGSNPDNGVFKQFIADTYKVPSVTYEMGDNTPREKIRYIAGAAAQTLMRSLLSYTPDEYDYKEQ
ncbi:MAG: peptidase M14 [Alteromonadaceae bacterium]|nr:peptidase M14 [Alteromonadaceae bacterium]